VTYLHITIYYSAALFGWSCSQEPVPISTGTN